jgi:short-subunit dehydrogenase
MLRLRSSSVPPMQLNDSTVLLTGATGGIGQAIAHALDARGAKLILTGRRADILDRLQEELGGNHRQLPADLANAGDAAALAEAAGAVDILIANAALPASGPLEGFSSLEIDRALDVNLRAPTQLARALLPGMLERRSGHLVFVSSLSGKVASRGSALYSATKFGLRGLAAGMREDLHGSGVGVSGVYPGFVRDAGMFADSGVKLPSYVGTTTPERVADAVIKGVEQNRLELDVAPVGMRVGVKLAELTPSLSARIQRRLGSGDIADEIARNQRDKR